jgi:DNA-binding transcriptional ArsR family regulator
MVGSEDVFQVVASPIRRALLDTLARGERTVSDLVARVDVSQSAVSQQRAILRDAGLVDERSEGRFRIYRLRPRRLTEIEAWMSRYRALLDRQLDALGRVLDGMPEEKRHPPRVAGRRRRRRATRPARLPRRPR